MSANLTPDATSTLRGRQLATPGDHENDRKALLRSRSDGTGSAGETGPAASERRESTEQATDGDGSSHEANISFIAPDEEDDGSPAGSREGLGPILPSSLKREHRPVDDTPVRFYPSTGDATSDSRQNVLEFTRVDEEDDDEAATARIDARRAPARRPFLRTTQDTAFRGDAELARQRRKRKRRPVTTFQDRFEAVEAELRPQKRVRLAVKGHKASLARTPRRDGAGRVDFDTGLAPPQPVLVVKSVPSVKKRYVRRAFRRPGRLAFLPAHIAHGGQEARPIDLATSQPPPVRRTPPAPQRRRALKAKPQTPAFSFGGGKKRIQQTTPPETVERRPPSPHNDIIFEPDWTTDVFNENAVEPPVDLEQCSWHCMLERLTNADLAEAFADVEPVRVEPVRVEPVRVEPVFVPVTRAPALVVNDRQRLVLAPNTPKSSPARRTAAERSSIPPTSSPRLPPTLPEPDESEEVYMVGSGWRAGVRQSTADEELWLDGSRWRSGLRPLNPLNHPSDANMQLDGSDYRYAPRLR